LAAAAALPSGAGAGGGLARVAAAGLVGRALGRRPPPRRLAHIGGEIGGERAPLPGNLEDWPAVSLELWDQPPLAAVIKNRPGQRQVPTDQVF